MACDRACDTVGLTLNNGSPQNESLLSMVTPHLKRNAVSPHSGPDS